MSRESWKIKKGGRCTNTIDNKNYLYADKIIYIKILSHTTKDNNIYYKTVVIKRLCYSWNNKQWDQMNKLKSPEIHVHIYGHLIYDHYSVVGEELFF